MNKHLYVTTTIPYVNAAPHIGFALELVQADVITRYHRLTSASVRLQTGTDENAFKNVLSARERGIPVRRLVDENAARFQELVRRLHISADRFVRTTEPVHRQAVHAFLAHLRPGDVYQASYEGLYCSGCEDFYLEGDVEDRRCPEHGIALAEVAERNHFFRLSAYQEQLHELIASRRIRIVPDGRECEVLSFIARGLSDISISRDTERAEGWGIPFPGDPTQVVYVWIDALINYLTGLGYPDGDDVSRHWERAAKCHVIGKNVWKFHAVYWPALLLSAGLDVPDEIVVHGFLTNEGRKISKSAGNGVDPLEYVEEFGVDGVRHFLLRHVRPFDDSDFSRTRLAAAYNADLSNGIGNLTSRLTALAESAQVGGIAREPGLPPNGFQDLVEAHRFDLALAALWDEIGQINRELGEVKPWDLVKNGKLEDARSSISPLLHRLLTVSHWLSPFLPSTAVTINSVLSAAPIRRTPPLFPRIQSLT